MRTISLFGTAAAAAVLVAAPALAQEQPADGAATDHSAHETPAPTLDSDSDGTPDAWDRDGDGTADAWDEDGDGAPDAVDDDGDGEPDAPEPR